jgi:hypothetical protein
VTCMTGLIGHNYISSTQYQQGTSSESPCSCLRRGCEFPDSDSDLSGWLPTRCQAGSHALRLALVLPHHPSFGFARDEWSPPIEIQLPRRRHSSQPSIDSQLGLIPHTGDTKVPLWVRSGLRADNWRQWDLALE